MKRTCTLVTGLVLSTMLMVTAAKAQSVNQPLIAQIPFEFTAGERVLPAGKYFMTTVNPSSDQRVIKLTAVGSGESVMLGMRAITVTATEHSSLLFHRYGERYFLSTATTSGETTAMQAVRSEAEREAFKALAGMSPIKETVALKTR